MIDQRISAAHGAIAHGEPNRRQQLALERIEFAVGELASVLLSSCRSGDTAQSADFGCPQHNAHGEPNRRQKLALEQ